MLSACILSGKMSITSWSHLFHILYVKISFGSFGKLEDHGLSLNAKFMNVHHYTKLGLLQQVLLQQKNYSSNK
jgi:hypothetical protein